MTAAARSATDLLLGEWACLGVIAEGPTHGFAVSKRLANDGDIGRVWSLSRPLTYRAIDQLTRRTYIAAVGEERGIAGGNRTIMAITPAGRRVYRRWLTTPVTHLRDLRSELLLKLILATRAGRDVSSLLERQHEHVAEIAGSLARQARHDPDDLVIRWRQEASEAALRFIERTIDTQGQR